MSLSHISFSFFSPPFFILGFFSVFFQSESQDQVFLRWTSGETATMHILVVHAMVILLTLGPPQGEWHVLRFIQEVLCNPESLPYICHLLTGQAGFSPSTALVCSCKI